LERLATTAHLVGRDADSEEVWGRAHQEWLRLGGAERAVRCVFWLALGLLSRGELARSGGWLTRAQRLLDNGQLDRVEQGYLLMAFAAQRLSGRHPGQVPIRPDGWWGRRLRPVVKFMATHVLTVKTPMGRAVRQRFQVEGGRFARGLPLGRVRRKDLAAAGIQRMPRTAGARGGRPVVDDGRILEVANGLQRMR
jgi:hypothetical protein